MTECQPPDRSGNILEYLETATERYNALIHAYCLMGNHYHLLLETPSGNLPQIMQHINGAYTTYFNVKRARAGHLFQGRYKAILVEMDEYAKDLFCIQQKLIAVILVLLTAKGTVSDF